MGREQTALGRTGEEKELSHQVTIYGHTERTGCVASSGFWGFLLGVVSYEACPKIKASGPADKSTYGSDLTVEDQARFKSMDWRWLWDDSEAKAVLRYGLLFCG